MKYSANILKLNVRIFFKFSNTSIEYVYYSNNEVCCNSSQVFFSMSKFIIVVRKIAMTYLSHYCWQFSHIPVNIKTQGVADWKKLEGEEAEDNQEMRDLAIEYIPWMFWVFNETRLIENMEDTDEILVLISIWNNLFASCDLFSFFQPYKTLSSPRRFFKDIICCY